MIFLDFFNCVRKLLEIFFVDKSQPCNRDGVDISYTFYTSMISETLG
jgi:hypothetical protein